MSDIKSHNVNTDIKSFRDIKSAGDKIKDTYDKTIKDSSDDNTLEQNTENATVAVGAGVAKGTYAGAKFGYKLATKRNRQALHQAQVRYQASRMQYRKQVRDGRARVRSARKDYRQEKSSIKKMGKSNNIKSSSTAQTISVTNPYYTGNWNQSGQIKSSKNAYNSTKKTEKMVRKTARKEVRSNWFELFKVAAAGSAKSGLYTALAVVLAVVVGGSVIVLMLSPSGVLFSDADEKNGAYSLNSAMESINQEFAEKLKAIESANTYDEEIINNYGRQYEIANWADIVAVWSVKNTSEENASFYIDEAAFQSLRTVAFDMTTISGKLETRTEDGDDGTRTVTTLILDVSYTSSDTMKETYNFSDEQKASVLDLFADSDYLSLFEKVNATGVPGGDYSSDFAAKSEDGKFIYPTSYHTVSGGYPNYASGKYHGALDFPCPVGTSVYAVGDGVVEMAGWHYSYGYFVKINHGNGITTIVAHNSQLVVSVGQTVTQGQLVAYSGSTGNSTGPHCHFEVRVNNQRVNPNNYL